MGGEAFAVDALRVREVVGRAEWQPMVEGDGDGFIRSRGKTVPVLDLRVKFGFLPVARQGAHSFIVVQVRDDRNRLAALLVDSLLEMIHVPPEQSAAVKSPLGEVPGRFLKAVVKGGSGPVYLLELDEVLGEPEWVLENKAS